MKGFVGVRSLALFLLLVGWCAPGGATAAERVRLESGEVYDGRSAGVVDGELLWIADDGSTQQIPLESIVDLAIPPAPAVPADALPLVEAVTEPDEVFAAEPAAAAPPPTFIPLRSPLQTMWRRLWWLDEPLTNTMFRATLGVNSVTGNADLATTDVRGEWERASEHTFKQLDLGGQHHETPTIVTANRWFLNWNMDRKFEGSQWILFTTSKNEYNGVANVDYRGSISTGFGYWFIQKPEKRLIVRFGPGVTYEKFQRDTESRVTPDFFGEVEARWPCFDRTSLEQRLRIQPSVANWELFRAFTMTSVIIDLDSDDRWKLRLGLRCEYVSIPAAGRVPADVGTTLSLVYHRK